MALDKGVLEATKYILTNYPATRSDDYVLISKVVERLNPSIKGLKFNFVLENSKILGLPSFKTIARTRRKLQHDYPELKANEETKEARTELEEEYKEFARS